MTEIKLKLDDESTDEYENAKKLLFETADAIEKLTLQQQEKLMCEFAQYKGQYGLYLMMKQQRGW